MIEPIKAALTAAAQLPVKKPQDHDPVLLKLSRELEANFLSEMLKSAGINKSGGSFGGGAGEDAFSSLLTQQYAQKMANAGGIGLAQHIYKSLAGRDDTA